MITVDLRGIESPGVQLETLSFFIGLLGWWEGLRESKHQQFNIDEWQAYSRVLCMLTWSGVHEYFKPS